MFNKFSQFMMGRYGNDKFNFALLILALIISILGQILSLWTLLVISYAFLGYTIFRSFSRNIAARTKEYNSFLRVYNPFSIWFNLKKKVFQQRKTYKYFKCPNCKQQLRAPRGRGKIHVTCQKCHKEFNKKV